MLPTRPPRANRGQAPRAAVASRAATTISAPPASVRAPGTSPSSSEGERDAVDGLERGDDARRVRGHAVERAR